MLTMLTTFTAGLFVVATSAQTLLGSPPQPSMPQSEALARPITIIGCLQSDQRTLSITPDTAGGPTTVTYILTPARDVNLTTHLGQIVQITGIEPSSSQGTIPAKTGTTTDERADATAQATTPAAIVVRAVNVTTVKTVAADCRPPT